MNALPRLLLPLLASIASVAVIPPLAAQKPVLISTPYNGYFFFGDSLSDSGNLFTVTSGGMPPAPYFNGRFSNGPVFSEFVASGLLLGTTAPGTATNNINFAFGGATANAGGSVPSLAQQVGMFQQRGIVAGPRQLFVVFAGANDLINTISTPATQNPAGVAATAASASDSVNTAVRSLFTGDPTRSVLVLTLPNIGRTPRFVTGSAAAAAPLATAGAAAFNNGLRTKLVGAAPVLPDFTFFGSADTASGGRIILGDTGAIFDEMIDNSFALGFSIVDREYLGTLVSGQNPGDVGQYLFWDGIHPTTKTHALLAAAVGEMSSPEKVLGSAAGHADGQHALGNHFSTVVSRRAELRHRDVLATPAAWAGYAYGDGGRDASGLAAASEFNFDRLMFGYDRPLGRFAVGAALSADWGKSRSSAGSNLKLQGQSVTLYGAMVEHRVLLDASVTYGSHDLRNISRVTALGGLKTSGSTSSRALTISSRAALGWDLGALRLMPSIGLTSTAATVDAYTEAGVGGLNFAFAEQEDNSTHLVAGLSGIWTAVVADRQVEIGAGANYRSDLTGGRRIIAGHLDDPVSTNVGIRADRGAGNSLNGELSVRIPFTSRWNGTAAYAVEAREEGKTGSTITALLGSTF